MVKRSVQVFHHFQEEVGADAGFVPCGWAFLVPGYASGAFGRNMDLLRQHRVETREITHEELKDLEPRLNLEDVERIAYEPDSGYADPHASTYAYAKRFCEMGGQLKQMTAACGLTVDGGKIQGVKTSDGEISTRIVVNAAGPWAGRVGQWAGLDLPIKITREQEVLLETGDAGGPPRLVCSDMAQAIYYRPDGRTRTLLGRGFPKEYEHVEPDQFNEKADPQFVEESGGRLMRRFPAFEKALVVGSYCGLYDVTPDWHPILGPVEEPEGLYLCAGFSGHGFKIAPAVGELMAEEILDGKAGCVGIRPFRLSRFREGALLQGSYGGNRA